MEAKIGIDSAFIAKTAELLNVFLADEFLLSLKTKNAHWNIEGNDFYEKHLFFEQQYKKMDELTDDIAEYIRSLGHYVPATMKTFLQLTHINERQYQGNDGNAYVKELLADHEDIIIRCREIDRLSDEWNDSGVSDFITSIMQVHVRMAWMLRAQLN